MDIKMSYKYKNSFKTWSDNNGRLRSTKRIKTGLEIVWSQKTADNTQILPKYVNQNRMRPKTTQNKETLGKAKKMGR